MSETQVTRGYRNPVLAATFGGLLCVAALLAGLTIHSSTASVPPSSQSDYPVLPDPAWATTVPMSLEDQVKTATLIVDATVAQVLPNETRPLPVEPGSAEDRIDAKIGNTQPTATFGRITVTVNEVLKGQADHSIVMEISPFALDCSPDFAPGDRMVLFLFQDDAGRYFSVSLQDAYWYVARDARVYPAVLTDQVKAYSGNGLGPFKSAINAIKHAAR